MKKWIFSLLLASGMTSSELTSQFMIEHDHSEAIKSFSPSDPEYLNPDLVETGHLTVKGMKITNFDSTQKAKLMQAFQLLEEVVNTEEFKDQIINFENKKGKRQFASNEGFSNEEIYTMFMEGREVLQPNTPGEMNFYLNMYNRYFTRVIGYTSPGTNVININKKFFKKNIAYEVASNLAHEWVHKLGFGHKNAKEHDSVPYAIGYIVEQMGKKLTLRPQKVSPLH